MACALVSDAVRLFEIVPCSFRIRMDGVSELVTRLLSVV